ncbi:MAG: TonB-dependent receptor plug domain-containing protein [Gemmatimonadota bacterium]
MRFNATDGLALALIGVSAVASVGITAGLRTADAAMDRVDRLEKVERVERVRVEQIVRHEHGTEAMHEHRVEDRLDDGEHARLHIRRDRGEGATVVRIRGDASATAPQVRIRSRSADGQGAITVTEAVAQPLIYIDGERYEGEVSDLAPDDIERIEIVKGAAALELFGEEAVGGVIQIFLKASASPSSGR